MLLADVGSGDGGDPNMLAISVVTHGFIAHERMYILNDLLFSARRGRGESGVVCLARFSSSSLGGRGELEDDRCVPTSSLPPCFVSLAARAFLRTSAILGPNRSKISACSCSLSSSVIAPTLKRLSSSTCARHPCGELSAGGSFSSRRRLLEEGWTTGTSRALFWAPLRARENALCERC